MFKSFIQMLALAAFSLATAGATQAQGSADALVRQISVLGRVDHVQAGADHGDGVALGFECAAVGGPVYA